MVHRSKPANPEVAIADRIVGSGRPCFVIAEIGQSHDGSLGTAHAYIDAVAQAGSDAVKFQTHIAAAESTPSETFRVAFSRQDASRYDYWRRMEFTPDQWRGLAEHSRDGGLVFLSSAFSEAAVDLLAALDCPAWKVGSGEVSSLYLLRRMAATGKPVMLSSGMSSWDDLSQAIDCIHTEGSDVVLFQCTTAYPCPPQRWGLNLIGELRTRFDCPVGYSDHSGNIYAGLAAAALRADLVEVHVVFSRDCFGPDVPASVTLSDFKSLVEGIRQIDAALAHPVDKDAAANDVSDLRVLFGKSLVATRTLAVGEVLQESDVCFKKPGSGIPATQIGRVLGCRLARSVAADDLLSLDDLETPNPPAVRDDWRTDE